MRLEEHRAYLAERLTASLTEARAAIEAAQRARIELKKIGASPHDALNLNAIETLITTDLGTASGWEINYKKENEIAGRI